MRIQVAGQCALEAEGERIRLLARQLRPGGHGSRSSLLSQIITEVRRRHSSSMWAKMVERSLSTGSLSGMGCLAKSSFRPMA